MISFRFHIVSITAVFLAIAIGVVVGTTYVDRAVVDSLENRVDQVSRNLDARKAENDALDRDLNDLRSYAGASAEFAVTGRLTNVPVLILAARGVDENVARQTLALARTAGASTPGVVWLEDRWGLDGDSDRDVLADAAGIDRDRSNEVVRDAALAALVAALVPVADPGESTPDAGEADEVAVAAVDVLAELVDNGFLTVDAQGDAAPEFGGLAGQAPRVLLLTTSDLAGQSDAPIAAIAAHTSAAGLPTVVAEAFVTRGDGPKRGEAILALLEPEVREAVAVIDDLEAPEGRVAAVLAVAGAATVQSGHFGYGSGADGVLPPWSAP